ncbi:MAG: OmpP1/FadL family transporter [Planctomycetota bacterium]
MVREFSLSRTIALIAGTSFLGGAFSSTAEAQGVWVSAAGPINRSMGGASVAAPIDSIGAIYWNPASISGLKSSEVAFGLDVLWSQQTNSTSIGPFFGETDSNNGTFPVPNVAWTYKSGIPNVTLGLGVNAIAGFKSNFPASQTNLALAPPPLGLGSVNAQAQFLQLAPVVSYAVTDQLSVAAGPTLVTGELVVDPFVLDSANSNGTYPSGRASEYEWGGGFQFGVYYILNDAWRFGSSFKSTQWMSTFRYNGEDANGLPREMSADFELPMVLSVGTSYAGIENWLIALDVRYFDYGNTAGFGDAAVFQPDGSLGGLDWSSVVATALGVQRKFGDRFALRGGYTYNQSPIKDSEAFYNIASSLFYEHMLSTGFSFTPNRSLSFNAAYSHIFENTLTGPLVSPISGAIPGTAFSSSMAANFLSAGISVFY